MRTPRRRRRPALLVSVVPVVPVQPHTQCLAWHRHHDRWEATEGRGEQATLQVLQRADAQVAYPFTTCAGRASGPARTSGGLGRLVRMCCPVLQGSRSTDAACAACLRGVATADMPTATATAHSVHTPWRHGMHACSASSLQLHAPPTPACLCITQQPVVSVSAHAAVAAVQVLISNHMLAGSWV